MCIVDCPFIFLLHTRYRCCCTVPVAAWYQENPCLLRTETKYFFPCVSEQRGGRSTIDGRQMADADPAAAAAAPVVGGEVLFKNTHKGVSELKIKDLLCSTSVRMVDQEKWCNMLCCCSSYPIVKTTFIVCANVCAAGRVQAGIIVDSPRCIRNVLYSSSTR